MRGWIELCSDVNWIDYHGMWAKNARDGSWYVIQWTNLVDACGERDAKEMGGEFSCEVKRLDLGDVGKKEIDSALQSCGYRIEAGEVVSEGGDVVADGAHFEACIVECAIQYGLGAPLESFGGSKRPLNIRANARRYAESCIRDSALLAERLARPVNRLGSTAAEYGRGDLDSALNRGPFDTAKNLMRKLHGKAPGVES